MVHDLNYKRACINSYKIVVNHEIPIQDIRDMFEANRRFF